MKLKLLISALAACTILTAPALADDRKKGKRGGSQAQSTSIAAGEARAGRQGASARGVGASQAMTGRTRNTRCVPSTAATNTNGAVFTSRRSGSAAVSTSGTAAGSGTANSSSEGEVFSSTDKQGSQADGYGNSQASATASTRC